ncbi:MAG: DUF2177 family protein [Rhizobacter sp.]
MSRYLLAGAATALVMMALDALWLGFIAKPLYQDGLGHLMAERPNLWAAGAFYAIYALGLLVFAVMPHLGESGWRATAGSAALFGLVAYATYDLSNLATLKAWPIGLSLMDMAWGSAASAIAAVAGKAAADWSSAAG